MKDSKLIAIDLFCGCGGFSYGFQQAGFMMALGIDMWKDATVTYKHNFPGAKVINDDITKVSGKDIINKLKLSNDEVDVIIGGPPCQGFSVSGKRMLDDPRNILYKSFVEIVQEIKPKVFIMENVPGLIRLFGGKVKDEVLEDFSRLGYEVRVQLLSSDEYGVPQQRKRVSARIQSFPGKFEFIGIKTSQLKQVGNAVPPLVARAIAGEIKKLLERG